MFNTESNVKFFGNRADEQGGAVHASITQSSITFDDNLSLYLHNNYARLAGNTLYINVPQLCNNSCLNDSSGVNKISQNNTFNKDIATTPNRIELYHPAIFFEYNTRSECQIYYLDKIMLGQEIIADVCVLDYYSQPSNAVQFTVGGEDDPNYHINGPSDILVSCGKNSFRGFSIVGNKSVISGGTFNFSVFIRYYIDSFSNEKLFRIELVVEISPCHPGFWYNKDVLLKCTCYNDIDVVSCSGTSSTIKRGYWFGSVNG